MKRFRLHKNKSTWRLKCHGRDDGSKCPFNCIVVGGTNVKLDQRRIPLSQLHLDHNTDLNQTCELWRQAHQRDGSKWHGDLDPAGLCASLFDDLTFRCCLPGLPVSQRCHRIDLAHYDS